MCVVRSMLFYANRIFYGFEDAPSNLSGFGAIFKLIQGKCYPKTMPYRMHRCQRDTAELLVYAAACIVCIRWKKIDYLCRNRRAAHVNSATNHNKNKVVKQLTDAFIDSRSRTVI